MNLKPEVRAAWVKELREGGRLQATERLAIVAHDGESISFCCLGVLCELAIGDGVTVGRYLVDEVGEGMVFAYNGEDTTPPYQVDLWAGLKDKGSVHNGFDPWFVSVAIAQSAGYTGPVDEANDKVWLAAMNDYGASFAMIADAIELDGREDES